MSQKPAISSLVSANGPSTIVGFEPANLMRAPFEDGCKPSPESMIPAFTSCSLKAPISANSSFVGRTPASLRSVALTMTMNRIGVSLLVSGGSTYAPSDASPNRHAETSFYGHRSLPGADAFGTRRRAREAPERRTRSRRPHALDALYLR